MNKAPIWWLPPSMLAVLGKELPPLPATKPADNAFLRGDIQMIATYSFMADGSVTREAGTAPSVPRRSER